MYSETQKDGHSLLTVFIMRKQIFEQVTQPTHSTPSHPCAHYLSQQSNSKDISPNLSNSKISAASQSTLSSSPYTRLFTMYSQQPSPVDLLLQTFQPALLLDPLTHPLAKPQAHHFLPVSIQQSITHVSSFFNRSEGQQKYQYFGQEKKNEKSVVWMSEKYAEYLASSSFFPQVETFNDHIQQLKKLAEQDRSSFPQPMINIQPQPKPAVNNGKLQLLLAELTCQKLRKGVSKCYNQAMQIKLNQLFDLLTQDDDLYLGLPLKEKIRELLHHLPQFKGQSIEGYIKLPLFLCLLNEYKQLQMEMKEGVKEKRQEKRSVCSDQKAKQKKKGQKKGYSQPPTKRPLREEDWIGSLA